ncbi:MAG: hypothetical protein OIN66_09770 [Candidatus Methanoperedens sp.]|nr:hypothetical protein [Candidatus Methanoperedens sp.]
MKKMIITWVLFAAIILISGCTDTEEKPSGTTQIPNSQPAGNLPANVSVNRVETPAGAVRLENYDGQFFSINKPAGWEVIPAGSCSTFSFLIRDKNTPGSQIFYFGEVGPVYLTREQKVVDKQYMDMGGYPITWYEMPVVDPLTPENFLKQFHLIAQTNMAKNFMQQIPELKNVEIISSNKAQSILQGDTKIVRALFIQNGKTNEGLFYVTVTPLLPSSGYPAGGIGYAFSFIGISAEKDDFKNMQDKLTESIGSFSLSQAYVNNCLQQQAQTTQGILKAGKTLSETSDIIMSSWENRNRVDDILSEKRSDVILGKDRVYNPATAEVFEVPNGFYDDYNINRQKYDMNNLQRLPDNDWNLWTSSVIDGSKIH